MYVSNMTTLHITDSLSPTTHRTSSNAKPAMTILSPILKGLTASAADCAIVMPRGNANSLLLDELDRHAPTDCDCIAAVLCADPFTTAQTLSTQLLARDVRAVTNWPSSIFFENETARAMVAIPAGPQHEIDWLAEAQKLGLETYFFAISREQSLRALQAGLSNIILHPGLPFDVTEHTLENLEKSLAAIAEDLKQENQKANIYAYRHPSLFPSSSHPADWADGLVEYGLAS